MLVPAEAASAVRGAGLRAPQAVLTWKLALSAGRSFGLVIHRIEDLADRDLVLQVLVLCQATLRSGAPRSLGLRFGS